jgi:hypothetical protein
MGRGAADHHVQLFLQCHGGKQAADGGGNDGVSAGGVSASTGAAGIIAASEASSRNLTFMGKGSAYGVGP